MNNAIILSRALAIQVQQPPHKGGGKQLLRIALSSTKGFLIINLKESRVFQGEMAWKLKPRLLLQRTWFSSQKPQGSCIAFVRENLTPSGLCGHCTNALSITHAHRKATSVNRAALYIHSQPGTHATQNCYAELLGDQVITLPKDSQQRASDKQPGRSGLANKMKYWVSYSRRREPSPKLSVDLYIYVL